MKPKFIYVYLLFLIPEYCFRTFIDSYKYHEVGFALEYLHIAIAVLLASIFYIKIIETSGFGFTYLKLAFLSIAGFLTAKTIFFFQWYWILAPEYRYLPGDMEEGLAWDTFCFIVGSVVILFSYLITILTIRSKYKMVKT